MSRPSYAKALDTLLKPLGFRKEGSDWIRIRGDMWECVNRQASWLGGVTVNMEMKDLATATILEAIPCDPPLFMWPTTKRIGQLIDGYDRWWKNDEPDGPAQLAEAVRTYGLPWFDKVRSIEDQAAQWYGREGASLWRTSEHPLGRVSPWRKTSLERLAVTLYRMGEIEEAIGLFDAPVPKTALPLLVTQGRCVQRWLARQAEAKRPIS